MSRTLLRVGLWTIVAVLALYIMREAMSGSPFARSLSDTLLNTIGLVGLGIVGFAVILGIAEFIGRKTLRKSFCIVCHRKIRYGDLYCREHLRDQVYEGQDQSRRTPGRIR